MKEMIKPSVQTTSFDEILEKYGMFVYTNVGCSMMPLLRQHKDVIEIRKKEPGRCKKYDVVLYKRGSKYIMHRILKVLPDGYLIAGDHCVVLEKDIKDDNILGVMTSVKRNGKIITPDNIWYKMYVHIWCDVYPVRFFILRLSWYIKSHIKASINRIRKTDK